jgi:signal transduction histidine kinase
MSIRTRLTIWYGGILLVSLFVMAAVLYHEWGEQVRAQQAKAQPEPVWEEVGETLLYYGAPTAIVLLVGGWIILGRALSPITALTRAADRIDLNNLKERLPSTGHGDELDRLANVFNAMMTRLESSYASVRDFTLHASHELKTPLTIMHAELESALREGIDGTQRQLFANQLDEIQRLSRIVDGLSLLSKADAGQAVLHREPVRLDELVRDSIADTQMLARANHIEVDLLKCQEVTVLGDRHRLRQLLLNLGDNAVKYNQPKGRINVSLLRQNGTAELSIANTGAGIPPEKLPFVFDRFFRGDASHSNEVEGCGLGLSIAQWIVKAHGGDIRIDSEQNGLTTVTVSMRPNAA